jgi:hypothetical protein
MSGPDPARLTRKQRCRLQSVKVRQLGQRPGSVVISTPALDGRAVAIRASLDTRPSHKRPDRVEIAMARKNLFRARARRQALIHDSTGFRRFNPDSAPNANATD